MEISLENVFSDFHCKKRPLDFASIGNSSVVDTDPQKYIWEGWSAPLKFSSVASSCSSLTE